MSALIPGSRTAAEHSQLLTDLDRARAIAVALEQECAELRRQVDEPLTTVTGLSDMVADQDDTVDAPVAEADLDAMVLALRTAWRRGYAAGKGST